MADVRNDLGTGLVSYWSMNEASGTRYDAHGINHLTANGTGGVGSATGKIGTYAADFENGDTDYLSIADASQSGLDLTGDFTISFWVKSEGDGNNYMCLFSKDDAASNRSFLVFYDNRAPDRISVSLFGNSYAGGTTDAWEGDIAVSLTTATWHHIVISVDISEATNKVYLYKDGTGVGYLSKTYGDGTTTIKNTGAAFQMGYVGHLQAFDGLIDEVGIWSSVLTSGNVTTLYNSGNGIPYLSATTIGGNTALTTNLVACYEFDETSGTTAVDAHSTNDGTIAGTISVNQTGKLDKCYLFPYSTSSYVSLPAGTKITGATARTFTAWVKTATLVEPAVILSMGDAATNQWFSFEVHNTTASSKYKLHFQKYGTNYTTTAGFVTDATWTFVFLRYDGASTVQVGTVTSGTVASEDIGVGTINTGSTNVPYIGRFNFSAAEPWDGNLDQVCIWNRQLSFGELVALEGAGSGIPYGSASTFTPRVTFFM